MIELLWGERSVRSVANLTRDDANELFSRLKTLRVHTRRIFYPLTEANEALDAVRSGEIAGTAVLKVEPGRSGTSVQEWTPPGSSSPDVGRRAGTSTTYG